MELLLHEYELPLKHPFTISRGTTTAQRTLIVELQQDGMSGYGEATANSYYDSSMDLMRTRLQAMQPLLGSEMFRDTESFWNLCAGHLADAPFVLSALDCAKLAEMPGWPVYKIKLGTARDVQIIRGLREHTDAVFRVDANCGWAPGEAAALSTEMAQQGVEFIEQPLPPEARKAQAELFRNSSLPLIADESCVGETDVLRCVDHFHGINIKLCKCGGLTPARRMIAAAHDHGLKVMVGCMTESSVGISAAAQLTPLLDYADLDGAVLLAKDAAEGVQLHEGKLTFPDEPGLGIRTLL